MNFNLLKIARSAVPLAALLLSACLGSGGSTPASTPGFTIGGAISGLSGSVVLQNNSGDNLSITSSGNFVFATKVNDGSAYSVTVLTQPAGQICSVSTGAGTVTGINVNSVVVTCASSGYTVSGSISGLGTHPVVLQNNGSDNLTVAANGTFNFATSVADGSAYNVSVLTQPADRRCSVKHGSGTMVGSNISNVNIVCAHQQGGAVQGIPLSLAPTVSTFAGTASFFLNGTGAAARFNGSDGSVSDGTNLYVTDRGNNAIRKVVIATGVVTTVAGSPTGVAGAADGTGTAATFNSPVDITTDGTNLYVADQNNNKIRQIVIATGAVTSLTGAANTAGAAGAADGAGATAAFNWPSGIITDGSNLYVTDTGNNKIRQIVIATGVVSSLTGTANTSMFPGVTDGAGAAATFNFPVGITIDGAHTSLYVADQNNQKIRQISLVLGTVSSLTGTANTATVLGAADGAGAAATFNSPGGIATDGTNLYVADIGSNKIRQIVIATGVVSSLTGTANTAMASGKANGALAAATFGSAQGVSYDAVHNSLFVADAGYSNVRVIALTSSTVSTLAGMMGPDGTGAVATFSSPYGTTTDGTNLYVADSSNQTIRKIVIATGAVTTLAGQTGVSGAADGTGTAATFSYPVGITTDGSNLYVADQNNNKIRKIVISTGVVSTFAGSGVPGAADGTGIAATFSNPNGITTDGSFLYTVEAGPCILRKIEIATQIVTTMVPSGCSNLDGIGAAAGFANPMDITTDGTNLYIVDNGSHNVRKVVIATNTVSTLAGAPSSPAVGHSVSGATDATGTAALFNTPQGITTDGTNLYVADSYNYKIRQIVIATGVVTSVTGTASTGMGSGAVDGAGASATLNVPYGITTDGSSLYVTDQSNNTIRKIQ